MTEQHYWILNQDASRGRQLLTTIGSGLRTVFVSETDGGLRLYEPAHEITEDISVLEWQMLPHLLVDIEMPFAQVLTKLRAYRSNLTE